MDQVTRIKLDANFWRLWGLPFGLRLSGFTGRSSATFIDSGSSNYVTVDETNFYFLDRIRREIQNG